MEAWDGPICVPPRDAWEVVVPDFPPMDELQERQWFRPETAKVLRLYRDGCSIYDLEDECGIALRHIVVRLLRLIFAVEGCLDDEETAPRSGEAYTAEDQRIMRSMHRQGRAPADIAQAVGRTPLGAGWKMLSLRIPQIPPAVAAEYLAGLSP